MMIRWRVMVMSYVWGRQEYYVNCLVLSKGGNGTTMETSKEYSGIGLQLAQARKRIVKSCAKNVMRLWRIVLVVRERCQPDFAYLIFGLRTQMPYEIEDWQIIEGVEMEQVFRIHDG